MTNEKKQYTLFFRISLLLLIFNCQLSIAQEHGFPIIRNYTSKEYKNSPQIFAAIQDKRGLMYFGVNNGVLEYNGVSWKNIPNDNKSIVYSLAMDDKGKIYVAAMGDFGYLTNDKKGNTIYKSLMPLVNDKTLKPGIVWSIHFASKFVYFRTDQAIVQYSPNSETINLIKADTLGAFYNGFIYKDVFYTQFGTKGLMKIENKQLIPAYHSTFFTNKKRFITAVPFNPSTFLLPTRREGNYLYQPENNAIPQVFVIANKDFFTNNSIYNAAAFQKDYFVLGSFKKGALLIDKQGNTIQQYNEQNLLQVNFVWNISIDSTQNIWFGLDNGITKAEHGMDLSYWDKNAGLKGVVLDIIRHAGTIYIATGSSIYYIDKKNQVQEVKGIPAGQNWCFLKPTNSGILLAGTQYGIFEIKENNAIPLYQGRHCFKIHQTLKNPNRIISADVEHFFSLKFEHGKWLFEGKWEGVKDNIRGIAEDKNGDLWLGTFNNGVIRVTPDYDHITKPKEVRYYTTKDGFVSLKDILPFTYKNKIIWGTENGLYVYNAQTDKFEPYCELGKQFCDGSRSIYSLKEMPDGKIWILPGYNIKEDIGYLNPNDKGGYDWVFAPFRRIPEMSLGAFYIEPDGVVWIGGSDGLYMYVKGKDTKNYAQKFNCLIRSVTCGADSLLFGGNSVDINVLGVQKQTSLNYKFNALKFEFAAPFFDHEERTLYSYQLVGSDKEWSTFSRQASKEYTNLSKGTYTFRVKAKNIYDVESEIGSYHFKILPPWYRTLGAYALYLTLLVILILLIIKIYTRRLVAKKEYLEQVVKERTAQIELQKEEILTQKDELEVANATKDKFFSIIAHDLRGPFSGFLGLTEVLAESLTDFTIDQIQDSVVKMRDSSVSLFRLLENLLQWSRMQQGTIPFNPELLPLHQLGEECIALTLEQAKNKEIEITCNIPDDLKVFADNNMLQTIIRNLVSNAMKFTPKGGKINVSAKATGDKGIEISIKDTGIGMTNEMVGNLFRLDVKTNRKGTDGEPSSGLGLLLCKDFIEKHGGKIGVESKEGNGTTFYFTLPTKP